ncbi:MAG: hypothetical protein JO101_02740, partial [Candidatus Eremiobacteraeota bacterium]|nr:hypothetical protein [Candidatus Eremiobacteraeota bacterium]
MPIALLVAALAVAIPIHGVVIETLPDRSAIVRTDAVPAMRPAAIGRYRLGSGATFAAGTAIDALLDPSTAPPTLQRPVAAAPFAPGLPQPGRAVPVEIGAALPTAELVDQNERIVQLARAFRGKTLVLSFVFTRCPDRTLCPAISAKFAYLQHDFDPSRFALAEI